MIVLLNSLPWVVTLLLVFWAYFRFSATDYTRPKLLILPLVILALFWTVYMKLQPSYLPKGEVTRNEIPVFEQKDYQVKDVQSKPMSGEERDARRKEQYNEPLPFVEKGVDNNK